MKTKTVVLVVVIVALLAGGAGAGIAPALGGGETAAQTPERAIKPTIADWRADLEKTLGYTLSGAQFNEWAKSIKKDCAEYGANAQQWADWQSPTLTPDFRTFLETQGVEYACPKNLPAIREGASINSAQVPEAERACETPVTLQSPLLVDEAMASC